MRSQETIYHKLKLVIFFIESEDVYFKLETFMDFMVKNRQNKKRNELIHYLRNGGAQNVIKNKSRMWKVSKTN
jgi:hypothetical protein